jgi:hypothetical protein
MGTSYEKRGGIIIGWFDMRFVALSTKKKL